MSSVEALEFRHELIRYLASRLAFGLGPSFWSARLSPLHLTQRDAPTPHRPGWVRVRTRLAGICGTDLSLVTGQDSLALEPEATYPFIPGHEIVGTVDSPGTARLEAGQRVVVWPVLGCDPRELARCPQCTDGWDGLCEARDGGWPDRGLAVGFNRDTGGGWAEAFQAHESQLWPIPADVSDEDAVLLDPAAASLAAVLRPEWGPGRRTLVIGGGPIGLLAAYLDRALGVSDELEIIVRHEHQAGWARSRGLDVSLIGGPTDFRDWADSRGMKPRRVQGYGHVYDGVFDRVVLAVGNRTGVRWSLNAVAPRGTVVLLAAPNHLRGVDPTRIWYREVTIRGVYDYGPVPRDGRAVHPYEVMIPMLRDGTLRFEDLVTHRFPIAEYAAAFRTLLGRRRSGALKAVFDFREDP